MTTSIAWLTPFGPASDIGSFSRNLVRRLAAVAEATDTRTCVLVNENGASYWSDLPTIALRGQAVDQAVLSAFDVCVYNIGNNQENHDHINRLALRVPGVVIVHDLAMHHYLAWHLFEQRRRHDLYADLMTEYYGAAGIDVIASSRVCSRHANPLYAPWDSSHVADFPLIEPFVQSAAAVVVHSEFAERAIAQLTDSPILRLALPWDQKPSPTESERAAWHERTRQTRRCAFVSFGHVSRAKCLELVIEAFAQSPALRAGASLQLVGHPGDALYVAELRSLVERHRLSDCVSFEFAVSDERLLEIKRSADVFVNLRYPNTESSSGSLVEQMNAGKPVVVFPAGSYGEVDGDAVIRVDMHGGVHALVAALDTTMASPALRIAVGERGRQFVQRMGSAEYVAGLLDFVQANDSLLRARKRCAAGVKAKLDGSGGSALGKDWLAATSRARELTDSLFTHRHALRAEAFDSWPAATLAKFIACGLFGLDADSRLEATCRAAASAGQRAALYRAVLTIDALRAQLGTEQAAPSAALLASPVLDETTWSLLAGLSSALFATGCYAFLLNRPPQPWEVDQYSTEIESRGPADVLATFLQSAEFQQVHGRRRTAGALLVWAQTQAQSHDRRTFPALHAGDTLQFSADLSNLQEYLVVGWHAAERAGVWSSSANCSIRFSVPPTQGAGSAARIATVFGRLAALDESEDRQLRIRCEGNELHAANVQGFHWFEARFALPASAERGIVLELDCDHTVNLKESGTSTDDRDLGLFLSGIALDA